MKMLLVNEYVAVREEDDKITVTLRGNLHFVAEKGKMKVIIEKQSDGE